MLNMLPGNDREDATKATSRSAYLEGTIPAWQTVGMSQARSRSYASLMDRFKGWVYAAAMTNARGVAAQTLRLYSKRPATGAKAIVDTRRISASKARYLRGELEDKPSIAVQRKAATGEVEEVMDHPILELLDTPTPDLDGYSLTILRLLNLQLTGNAYLHPILSETLNVPIELWPMPSHLVTILPDGELDLVKGYQYGMLPGRVDFDKEEVLHQRQPNPADQFYGKGWVSAAIEAIDLLESMDDYEQNVLDNQARPDWAVMVKEHLTDAQYQRLDQQIDRRLRGTKNRGRPFIFEGGIDGKPMQFSPQDLAFDTGETRKIEVVAAISGVPVSKLKANDPNLSNAREGNLAWLRDTIVPYLTLDEQFLNRQLLPLFGEFADSLFLAYDDPVHQDASQQATIDASDASAGIRTRNEIRAERGLPPVDGGDELLVPAGSIPIDMVTEQAERASMQPYGLFSTTPKTRDDEVNKPVEPVPGEEVTETELEGQPQQVDPVTALNGAQVTSALEIVNLVATGQMPREAAASQLQVFFNLTHDQADDILGDVGRGFVPAPIQTETTTASKDQECVEAKVPALMDEGYPRNQAIAIAHSMCNDEGSGYERREPKVQPEDPVPKGVGEEKSCGCHEDDWLAVRSMVGTKRAEVDDGNEDYKRLLARNAEAIEKFEEALEKIVAEQIQELVARGLDPNSIDSNTIEMMRLEDEARAFVESITLTTADDVLEQLGVADRGIDRGVVFDVLSPSVVQFLRSYTDELTSIVERGTQRDIRRIIADGIRDGKDKSDIEKGLMEVLEEGDDGVPLKNRARMIARTETAMIHEGAKEQAWIQSGIVKGKRWLLAAGGCPFCTALGDPNYDGALRPNPIPLGATFIGAGMPIVGTDGKTMTTWRSIKTAPLHPNCRCGTTEVLMDEDDELDMREQPS